jgi:hypothetical protein
LGTEIRSKKTLGTFDRSVGTDHLERPMRFKIATIAALASMASLSLPLAAQPPGHPGGPHGGAGFHRAPGVEFFLARTGQLELTDGQVTKLAAIARRAQERHKAMRASFDSMRTRGGPAMRGDTASRDARRSTLMATFKRAREAEHADLRDALAVLNPDQQAKAWEMIAARKHHRTDGHRRPGMRRGPGFPFGGPAGQQHWGKSGHDGHGANGDSSNAPSPSSSP